MKKVPPKSLASAKVVNKTGMLLCTYTYVRIFMYKCTYIHVYVETIQNFCVYMYLAIYRIFEVQNFRGSVSFVNKSSGMAL